MNPLAAFLERELEQKKHIVLQVFALGVTYRGPVVKTDIPNLYKIHTATQIPDSPEPVIMPVYFTCDHITGFMVIDEGFLSDADKPRIVV